MIRPVGKRVGLARRILTRWEEIRTDRVLRAPPREDPRVRAARMMANRIIGDDTVAIDVEDLVLRITDQIEGAVNDLRTIDFTAQAGASAADGADLRTDLEVRIARLLAGLAELHRALVVREAISVRAGVDDLRELLGQLNAENEVEVMLQRGPMHDFREMQAPRADRPAT
jgi:hypothetical protein